MLFVSSLQTPLFVTCYSANAGVCQHFVCSLILDFLVLVPNGLGSADDGFVMCLVVSSDCRVPEEVIK